MFFRQFAVATAIFAMLLAMFAIAGAPARVPTFDAGIGDWHKESNSAYSIEPDVIVLVEEDIVL